MLCAPSLSPSLLFIKVKSCSGGEALKTIVTGVLLIVHALVENALLFLVPYVSCKLYFNPPI